MHLTTTIQDCATCGQHCTRLYTILILYKLPYKINKIAATMLQLCYILYG